MAELTEREIKICHIFLTVLNHKFDDTPQDLKETMLSIMLQLRGYKYDEKELVDLVQALDVEQSLLTKAAMKALWKQKGSLGSLKNLNLFKL